MGLSLWGDCGPAWEDYQQIPPAVLAGPALKQTGPEGFVDGWAKTQVICAAKDICLPRGRRLAEGRREAMAEVKRPML